MFVFGHWEELMPYSVGAFFMFGLGSVPSGRLGDLWARWPMMLVFFFGLGGGAQIRLSPRERTRALFVMTAVAITGSLFMALALVSLGTASFVLLLPSEQPAAKASQGPSPTNPSAAG